MEDSKLRSFVDALIIMVTNFCIIVFGIWISTIPIAKSKSFYMSHFEKNEEAIQVLSGMSDEDPMAILERIADITIEYYFGNAKEYQVEIDGVPFYSDNEVRHMREVKTLFVIGQTIAVISFFTLIACIFYLARWFRRMRKKIIVYTACFYCGLIVLIGLFFLWGYINYMNDPYHNSYFAHLFINFHRLIFWSEDKFLLATSQGKYEGALANLTLALDLKLFSDAAIIIGLVTLGMILLWLITIIVFYKLHPLITRKVDEIHERARNSQKELHQTQNC
mgnify:FL=1